MKKLFIFSFLILNCCYSQTTNFAVFFASEFETGHYGYNRFCIKDESKPVNLEIEVYGDSIIINSHKKQKYINTLKIDYQSTDDMILKSTSAIDQDGDICKVTLKLYFNELIKIYRNMLTIEYNNIYVRYYLKM